MIRFLWLLFVSNALHALSIVFVHVGNAPLPSYLPVTVAQARLFNPNCPIYLIAPQEMLSIKEALQPFASLNVTYVPCESLTPSRVHRTFKNCETHKVNGFWLWTSERFFYLEEFIREQKLRDVFHLENDVMLYVDLETKLPIFQKYYSGMIAATFEKDDRCVPGFLYIANSLPIRKLIQSFPTQISPKTTDMETLAKFKNRYCGVWIDFLPITLPSYVSSVDSTVFEGKAEHPEDYTNHFDAFQSLFDAAAFGVFLAGWDAQYHAECHPGAVSKVCMFNSSHFSVEWELDEKGRRIPFVRYRDTKVRINNLHITNKRSIGLFYSLNP